MSIRYFDQQGHTKRITMYLRFPPLDWMSELAAPASLLPADRSLTESPFII